MVQVRARPSCSHERMHPITPTHIALLIRTLTLIGILPKRFERNMINGIAVPVKADRVSRKNIHLASTVGTVNKSNASIPPQPTNISVPAARYTSVIRSDILDLVITNDYISASRAREVHYYTSIHDVAYHNTFLVNIRVGDGYFNHGRNKAIKVPATKKGLNGNVVKGL